MAVELQTRRARVPISVSLAGAAVAWVAAYALNERLWDWVLLDWIGLDPEARMTESLHFFAYDLIKIALLLIAIVFVMTLLRTYMSVERTQKLLGGRREGLGNVAAAGLGVATPFCSCSAVPAFIGFLTAGIPLGVTLSFLIASPLVNEVAVGLLWVTFGWKVALLYIGAGLTIAIVAGFILGRVAPERWVERFARGGNLLAPPGGLNLLAPPKPTLADRAREGRAEVATIVRKIWPYLLVGIGIGAAIHGWVPADFFAEHAGADNPAGVLVAVGTGVPLYSNAAGVLPLVESLHAAGLPMGTLLAFMMSVVALSLPEMVLLKRVLKAPLIAAFIGVVAAGIVAMGYLFNAVLG
jgi:uncharacterized membrane protein YraQ (UPF0718 family)